MHPKETEIREVATRAPFVPFTVVTASDERYKVPTPDHISFFPDTDEDGVLQAEVLQANLPLGVDQAGRRRVTSVDEGEGSR